MIGQRVRRREDPRFLTGKGRYVDDLGTIGATPAALNAVIDAVSHLGVRHIDMPANGERVWRAIQVGPLGCSPSPMS
jgi:carbon-monoxide dehydrogenase large subunit